MTENNRRAASPAPEEFVLVPKETNGKCCVDLGREECGYPDCPGPEAAPRPAPDAGLVDIDPFPFGSQERVSTAVDRARKRLREVSADIAAGKLHHFTAKDTQLVQDLLAAISAPPGGVVERYRHRKGGIYRMVAIAKIEATPDQKVVVYQSEKDGTFWMRPEAEFFDGRFTALTAAGASSAKEGK